MFIYNYNLVLLKVLFMLSLTCFIVFFITFFCFLLYSYNFIYYLILNELLIFSIIIQLLIFGFLFDDLIPQIFVLFILVVSSCEIVIGFSLILTFFLKTQTIKI